MKDQPTPPRLFLRLFRWFCDPELHRFIEGDLLELYGERVGEIGKKKADRYFARDVILLFRPGIIRSFNWMKDLINQLHMLSNYFKLFRRNFKRQPTYNWLNLSCLSIGIAAAICIGLYLDFEINYDRNHQQADKIYRIGTSAITTHQKVIDVDWDGSSAQIGPLAQQDYPEIASFVRFFHFFSNEVRFDYETNIIEEEQEHVIAVDSNVFELFSFELLQGNPENALKGPNKIVISEDLARRIFGARNPVGETISTRLVHNVTNTEQNYPLEVSGVFRDLPQNTHLFFHAMISAETDTELNSYYFGRFNMYTYVMLNDQADPEVIAPKLTGIYDRNLDAAIDPVLVSATHKLIPLTSIHFSETGGSTYLLIFTGIGFLLLLIAFIGYINLVTAQAGQRALEIGLRKVLGSNRWQLIVQFLAESMFLTILSLVAALILVILVVGPLNTGLGLDLDARQLLQPRLIYVLLGVIFLLGLIGGSYPAFFLSSFQPVSVIKGTKTRSAPLQKGLFAFQFGAVLFVMASTGMIYQQLEFMRAKDLGFDQKNILQLSLQGQGASPKVHILKEQLQQDPNIRSIAACNFIPGVGGMINRPASAKGSEPQFIRVGQIDYDYLATMDIDLIAGRNFSPNFPADSIENVLVNQTFVRRFGLGEAALDEQVKFGDWGNPNALRIVGVVEDVHQSSLHSSIESQLYQLSRGSAYLVAKLNDDPASVLGHVEDTWSELFPDQPLQYSFLNERLQNRYEADQRRGRLFLLFSSITIFIAFAGLYGLAAYLTERRSREVGVRKVLGATRSSIVLLLSRNFLLLVLIAALPGILLAWMTMQKWLENFAFQAPLSYGLLGLVLILVLLLVLLTVGWHALRTAARNPREVLE